MCLASSISVQLLCFTVYLIATCVKIHIAMVKSSKFSTPAFSSAASASGSVAPFRPVADEARGEKRPLVFWNFNGTSFNGRL